MSKDGYKRDPEARNLLRGDRDAAGWSPGDIGSDGLVEIELSADVGGVGRSGQKVRVDPARARIIVAAQTRSDAVSRKPRKKKAGDAGGGE